MLAINPSSDPSGDACCRAAALDALRDAVDCAYGGVSMSRSRHGSSVAKSVPRVGLCEVLADPIVRTLVAADGTDRESVETMMRDVAARLTTSRKLTASRGCRNKGA